MVTPLPDWQQPVEEGDGVVFHNGQIIPAVAGHVEFWTSEPARTIHEAYGQRLLHREGFPAEIYYGDEGQVHSERWYHHGERHREDGPAETVYGDEEGQVDETYWLHDELLSKEQWEKRVKSQ